MPTTTTPATAARATLAAQSHRASTWDAALRDDGREALRQQALEAIAALRTDPRAA